MHSVPPEEHAKRPVFTGESGDGGNRTHATFPPSITPGTLVLAAGVLTRTLGARWCWLRGEWSYRLMHDISRRRGTALFHAPASDVTPWHPEMTA